VEPPRCQAPRWPALMEREARLCICQQLPARRAKWKAPLKQRPSAQERIARMARPSGADTLGVSRFLGASAAVLLIAGFSHAAKPLRFSVVRFQPTAEVAAPCRVVVTSNEQWNRLVSAAQAQVDRGVRFDFTRQTVVAIFGGQKPTGGYSLRVDRVEDESEPGKPFRARVHHRLVDPPSGAMLTQALTYPSVVIRLDKKFESVVLAPPIETACWSVQ